MKRIFIAPDLPRAQLVLDRLLEHGLAARILNAHAGTLLGEIPVLFACPEVWVEEDGDAGAARQVIETMEAAVSSGAVRSCPRCGAEVPVEFGTCWRCEADFD